jgi:DNA primase
MRCGLGWNGERIVFPVRTAKLKIAGVVGYLPGGDPKSKALPGSKRLLFPCPEVTSRKRPLFLVEGEPDAVSVWSCGHQAVAVPGTGGWKSEFLMRLLNRRVVVLADCDPQGRAHAERLAGEIPNSKWVDLQPYLADGSDIGDWVLGASREGGLAQMRDLLTRLAA